jgi:hypothetical protein
MQNKKRKFCGGNFPTTRNAKITLFYREKEKVNLTCEARGYPEPQVYS